MATTREVQLKIRVVDGYDIINPKTTISAVSGLSSALASKQDTLISGTTIKTVGGISILGAGNIAISTSLASLSDTTITTPANRDVLTYDSTAGKWLNKASTAVIVSSTEPVGQVDGDLWFHQLS